MAVIVFISFVQTRSECCYNSVMLDFSSRLYQASDQSACMAIFDSNVPTYLSAHERDEFGQYLDEIDIPDRHYLVLVREGVVVACGGLLAEGGAGEARLEWGMVDRRFHRNGLGRHLTQARIDLARKTPGIVALGLETSQHTGPFYERFGFKVDRMIKDGFGPGLDRWDMTLRL